jgi:drug/metabolite transporter (DMT)-like permease
MLDSLARLQASWTGSPQRLGIAAVVLSTFAIALVPSLARIAYDGGSNTLTVTSIRGLASVGLLYMALRMTGQSPTLARPTRRLAWVVGGAYAVMLLGLLGAVSFMPVNLVVLVYFTHPILVATLSSGPEIHSSRTRMLLASVLALFGLVLAVGTSLDQVEPRGLALACLASVACVAVILGCGKGTRSCGSLPFVFHMMLAGALVLSIAATVTAGFALPSTPGGWLGLSGVSLCATLGTLSFFYALPLIGTAKATMISNFEPVLGILFAVGLLGETLTVLQIAGIALVLVAVLSCTKA